MSNEKKGEQRYFHKLRDGEKLEILEIGNPNKPPCLVIPGILGQAEQDPLTDALKDDLRVIMYSPRGAGNSTGKLNLDADIQDVGEMAEFVEEKYETPVIVGMSLGGHKAARALGEDPSIAKKAVLLSPLRKLNEQNTYLLGKAAEFYRILGIHPESILGSDYIKMKGQRFHYETFIDFLRDVEKSQVQKKLQTPTLVALSGGTVWKKPIDNLDELAKQWKDLGATENTVQVVQYPYSNHWFSGSAGGYRRTTDPCSTCFSEIEEIGLAEKIRQYLK